MGTDFIYSRDWEGSRKREREREREGEEDFGFYERVGRCIPLKKNYEAFLF